MTKDVKKSEILKEAIKLAGGDRQQEYGSLSTNFNRIKRFLAASENPRLTALTNADICYLMAMTKLARNVNAYKRDNIVDGVNYFDFYAAFEEAEREHNATNAAGKAVPANDVAGAARSDSADQSEPYVEHVCTFDEVPKEEPRGGSSNRLVGRFEPRAKQSTWDGHNRTQIAWKTLCEAIAKAAEESDSFLHGIERIANRATSARPAGIAVTNPTRADARAAAKVIKTWLDNDVELRTFTLHKEELNKCIAAITRAID